MTKVSLEYLLWFLNKYPTSLKPNSRITDYGGTDNVWPGAVQEALSSGGQTNYHALDFDNGIDLLKPIRGPKSDLGICMDLLEHTSNPFTVAKNITDNLKLGAFLFVTVPFVWDLHFYPKDYWRFTPQGLEELFATATMDIKVLVIVRDHSETEILPLFRIIGVFQKSKKVSRSRDDESGCIYPEGWKQVKFEERGGFDKKTSTG